VDYDDQPDEEWVDEEEDDSEDDLLVCPSCGASVYEETQQCPHCGDWIIPAYRQSRWKRTAGIVVATLLILALIGWVIF
jgi:DNA-directed RNA polymerase subunit RPC12/RpoP